MRRIDHGLGGGAGIRAGQQAQHIVGLEFAHVTLDVRREAHRQFPGLEFPRTRARQHVVEFQARRREQFARHVELYPRRGLELGVLIVGCVHLLVAPGTAHHAPPIAREIGAMNDQGADRALARRLFEFVGPTPVIGQRPRIEELGVFGRRLVHDDQHDLALDVHPLEVVPAILGCNDAVADEHDGRIDVHAVRLPLIAGHVVLAEFQLQRAAVLRVQGGGRCRQRVHAGELDFLQVAAVVARRLQAIQGELRGNVLRGDVAAAGTGAASLEQVVG